MATQVLRPYQRSCVEAVFDAIEDNYKRILYTLPTGTGKSVTFAEIVKLLLEYFDARVLVLAHREELISQAEKHIRLHCGLTHYQIGVEQAEWKAPKDAKVIVGSVQTIKGAHRMPDWTPTHIITDEAHHSSAASYGSIFSRFKVGEEGGAISIGCTATARRTDRLSLFAKHPDGSKVHVFDKKLQSRREVLPEETAYDLHCFDYPISQAIDDGWLVPMVGHAVQTDTNLDGVEVGIDGDLKEGQLQSAVDNAKRTLKAIDGWKQHAENRSTIVFCAGVEHAKHSAQLWREAGYTAESLDGTSENKQRVETLEAFRNGTLQILTNCALFTEGMDAPRASCIVHLRPTKSWNMYCQMSGRGTRPLPGTVDPWPTATERRQAISDSDKPDCILLDVVDICSKFDLCRAPSILDLPAKLELDGATITEAKRVVDEWKELTGETLDTPVPISFKQLAVRTEQVSLMQTSTHEEARTWSVNGQGFRCKAMPPGYSVEATPVGDVTQKEFHIVARHHKDGVLWEAQGVQKVPFDQFLTRAARHAKKAVDTHAQTVRENTPTVSRGTVERLRNCGTGGWLRTLRARGHKDAEIDCMPFAKAKAMAQKYADEYFARKNGALSD